jgi:hypothetical protein
MPRPTRDPGPISFTATIEQENSHDGGAWVVFPFDLKELYGIGNLVPVVATFDGLEYRGSIAKMGEMPLLLVRKDVRQKLGKGAGDSVSVCVSLDTKPREVVEPADFKEAIDGDTEARRQFDAMSYSHRREYVQWIEEAKREETRQRRLQQALEMIRDGKRQR